MLFGSHVDFAYRIAVIEVGTQEPARPIRATVRPQSPTGLLRFYDSAGTDLPEFTKLAPHPLS